MAPGAEGEAAERHDAEVPAAPPGRAGIAGCGRSLKIAKFAATAADGATPASTATTAAGSGIQLAPPDRTSPCFRSVSKSVPLGPGDELRGERRHLVRDPRRAHRVPREKSDWKGRVGGRVLLRARDSDFQHREVPRQLGPRSDVVFPAAQNRPNHRFELNPIISVVCPAYFGTDCPQPAETSLGIQPNRADPRSAPTNDFDDDVCGGRGVARPANERTPAGGSSQRFSHRRSSGPPGVDDVDARASASNVERWRKADVATAAAAPPSTTTAAPTAATSTSSNAGGATAAATVAVL